ncbi:PAS domain S-box protein [Flavihumibacter petaseus]|uniref:histidine kinase n=1 Tax=Flavihumibacter petaseus NBRC 106054 TaxID=1220578 RepID=A0A0E9MYW4_9BACT|nr:PAS domain S-box protein [Flavihumibacter petaseus]GAO42799.1 putative two-component histidine kinase [Flavihumibacter petaseus NBRC 106054]
MIATSQSAIKKDQHIPYRFVSDESSLVLQCSDTLIQLSGHDPSSRKTPIDSLVHLDSNASKALRIATRFREPVCFRASVRIREESLLPVYWTVIPEEGQYQWYGFPASEKDRVEGRLKELELIVASFHDIVFELDRHGNCLNFWVRDPSKLYVQPSAFLGKDIRITIRNYFTPLADLLLGGVEDCFNGKQNGQVEYQLPGTMQWFACRFTPVLSPDSEIVGMLIIITDITSQRKLENSLRESEQQYRDLFENANDIIYIVELNSNIISMNRMAEALLEYNEEEMLGRSSHLFFAPEKLGEAIKQGRLKAERHTNTTIYESEFISRSGKRIAVEISSRLIVKEGVPVGIHVTARDITHQKISQQELAKSEARFRFLSEYARDMICLHRPNGDYVYVSPASKSLLGYEPEELVNRSPYEYFHPDDSAISLRDTLQLILLGIESPSTQYRFRHKDGSWVWLESVAKPIMDHGEVMYIQTNSRDISERKRSEQLLVEKDRLSSALAHASRLLLREIPMEQVLDQSFPVMGDAMQVESLFYFSEDGAHAHQFHIWCRNKVLTPQEKSVLCEGAAALLTGQVAEYHISTENNTRRKQWMSSVGYKSLLVAPISTPDGSWGIIGCGHKQEEKRWSMNVRNSLITFASSISSVVEKNRHDVQLRQSEEWFRTLFRNSLDIVFLVDSSGRLTYATPSLEANLGYKEADLLGEFCRTIIHPEEKKSFNNAIRKLAADPVHELVLPLRVLHSNGRWCWMEMKGQSKLNDPNIRGILLSLRDITEYIEIENTLKQYSDKITSMLHSITDGFIALGPDFRITMFNNVAQDMLHQVNGLRVGESAWELFPDATTSDSFYYLNKAVTENRTIRYEQYVESLHRWFDVSAFPYEDGLFIYFKDATDKKHQESLLQIEKEVLEMHAGSEADLADIADHLLRRLEELCRHMLGAICLVKHNGRESVFLAAPSMPPGFKDWINTTPLDPALTTCGRAMIQRQPVEIHDMASSDLAEDTRMSAAAMGIKATWSIPIISSSSEVLGILSLYFKQARAPLPDEKWIITRALHTFTMIMENRQAAERLRISNERYLLATRAANEAIWDWDAEQQVSFWGEGFKTLFGYPSEFYPGSSMNWENKIHPDDRERVLANITQYTSGGKKGLFTAEYRFLKADGTYAQVIDKGYCLYDQHGKVIRMIGSCEDVTERKTMEEQLLQQEIHKQQQIAQAVVDVQESERAEIGKELHDNVNQLLSTAKLFLEVAENDNSIQRQMIRRSSDTIMSAINEIRKISRSLMPASVSDLGLISSVNDLVQNIHLTKQLEISFKYDPNLDLLLHPKQKLMLFRIIQEQANNVLKHARATQLIIAIFPQPKIIRLEITDNGIGFDLTTAKLKDGVGLSNILSRAAIFNGEVQVNTAPGKGCQLIIDLPVTLTKAE